MNRRHLGPAFHRPLHAAASAVAVLATVVMVASCDGENPAGPDGFEVEAFDYQVTIQGPGVFVQDVAISVDSQVRATLSWSDAAKDLDLYWANTSCEVNPTTLAASGAECAIETQSVSVLGTSEEVNGAALAGTTVRFIVLNYTTGSEPLSLSVVVDPD